LSSIGLVKPAVSGSFVAFKPLLDALQCAGCSEPLDEPTSATNPYASLIGTEKAYRE